MRSSAGGRGDAARRSARSEKQLVPAAVVDDQHGVAGQPLPQLVDQRRRQERQVGGEHGDDVCRPDRRPAAARHGAAAGRLLPHQDDPVRDRLRGPDDDARGGAGHRGQDGGQHRPTADLQLRLGLPAEPGRLPPASTTAVNGGSGSMAETVGRRRGYRRAVGRVTSRTPVLRIRGAVHTTRPDTVAAEEPLEIRLDGTPLAVTMRTPGRRLRPGARVPATEGVIAGPTTSPRCATATGRRRRAQHLQRGRRRPGARRAEPGHRARAQLLHHQLLRGLRQGQHRRGPDDDRARRRRRRRSGCRCDVLLALPDRLRAAQQVFDKTGGLHAAGLFTAAGELLACARTSAGTTPSTR